MSVEIISKGVRIEEIKVDGVNYKLGEKVLLNLEQEEVTIDDLFENKLTLKFSDGWVGNRKYNQVTKIIKPFCVGCEEPVDKIFKDYGHDLCETCNDKYNNATGHCSLHCCIHGRCDETCQMEILTYSKNKYEVGDEIKVWEFNVQYLTKVKERSPDWNRKFTGKRFRYVVQTIRPLAKKTHKSF